MISDLWFHCAPEALNFLQIGGWILWSVLSGLRGMWDSKQWTASEGLWDYRTAGRVARGLDRCTAMPHSFE
jgi:hypothetical protein